MLSRVEARGRQCFWPEQTGSKLLPSGRSKVTEADNKPEQHHGDFGLRMSLLRAFSCGRRV